MSAAPVHILREGHALCGLRGPPDKWVDGATWVRRDEGGATCQVCIDCRDHGMPSWHAMDKRVRNLSAQLLETQGNRPALEAARDAAVIYAALVTQALQTGALDRPQVAMATAELLVLLGHTRNIVPETDTCVLDVVARLEASVRVAAAKREQEPAR